MPPEALSVDPASFVLPLRAPAVADPWPAAPPNLDVPPVSGWDAFDDLRLVRPGALLLFDVDLDAAALADRLLHGLAAGAVAQRGRAWVVDAGGSGLDAWRLAEAGAVLGLSPETLVDGVRVARVPHPGDLLALFDAKLPDVFDAHAGPAVLLVRGLPEACLDGALLSSDALALLDACLQRLQRLARTHRVAVVLSTSVLSRRATKPLRALLLGAVGEAASLRASPEGGLRVRVPGRGLELRTAPPA